MIERWTPEQAKALVDAWVGLLYRDNNRRTRRKAWFCLSRAAELSGTSGWRSIGSVSEFAVIALQIKDIKHTFVFD
jgi:hypothetical protein